MKIRPKDFSLEGVLRILK